MGQWTRKDATGFQPRKSPSKMKDMFPAETFIDGAGKAQDSLSWLYEDTNGMALSVAGIPIKYWTPDGSGSVREMTTLEKNVVDAAVAAVRTQRHRTEAINATSEVSGLGVETRALIELLNKRDNFLTNRLVEIQDALDAMKATGGGVQNVRDAIPGTWLATNTRTKDNAITDYTDDINAGNQDT